MQLPKCRPRTYLPIRGTLCTFWSRNDAVGTELVPQPVANPSSTSGMRSISTCTAYRTVERTSLDHEIKVQQKPSKYLTQKVKRFPSTVLASGKCPWSRRERQRREGNEAAHSVFGNCQMGGQRLGCSNSIELRRTELRTGGGGFRQFPMAYGEDKSLPALPA